LSALRLELGLPSPQSSAEAKEGRGFLLERVSGPTRRAKWVKKWFALAHSGPRDLVKTSRCSPYHGHDDSMPEPRVTPQVSFCHRRSHLLLHSYPDGQSQATAARCRCRWIRRGLLHIHRTATYMDGENRHALPRLCMHQVRHLPMLLLRLRSTAPRYPLK
jgi:hypothetical protein